MSEQWTNKRAKEEKRRRKKEKNGKRPEIYRIATEEVAAQWRGKETTLIYDEFFFGLFSCIFLM